MQKAFPALAVSHQRFEHRSDWKLFASDPAAEDSSLEFAVDDVPDTAYRTKDSKPYPGQWFEVELPTRAILTGLAIDATEFPEDFAPAYEVQVSDDGKIWSDPVGQGVGEPLTRLTFEKPVSARFVRITMTQKNGWQRWAISNLELYGEEASSPKAQTE